MVRSEKVVSLDYTDLAALTEALKGQDAVISTVGAAGTIGQRLFIDAAIAAGVQRFLPAEFGSDMSNDKASQLAVFGYKIAVRKYLEEKTVGTGMSYTYIVNGIFLDWGIEKNFLLDFQSGNQTIIYGSGDQLFSATTLASVGEAVVGTLNHLEQTKNRAVRIQDALVSQNKLLALAKKVDPKREWNITHVKLEDMEQSVKERLAKGDYSLPVLFDELKLSLCGEGYGQPYENENELVGLKGGKTDADIEAIWRTVLL